MQKPVWRLNTGKEPENKTGSVIFHKENIVFKNNSWVWRLTEGRRSNREIYAYETNRTKPAKYR